MNYLNLMLAVYFTNIDDSVSCYFQSYDCLLNIESLEKKLIHVEGQERYIMYMMHIYMFTTLSLILISKAEPVAFLIFFTRLIKLNALRV